MERAVFVVGHRNPDTDSICSAIAYAHLKNALGQANVRPARAGEIDAETAFVLSHFDVPAPELLTDAIGKDLILVDHNEIAQALPHIEDANILEIWEHHRIGDLRLPNPIVFHCEPVGATATLIGEQYFTYGLIPSRQMAGLMLASILSDTVSFRSPTVSEKDRRMAARLEPLCGIDAAFREEMLRRKTSAALQRSPRDILRSDYKEFEFGLSRVGISQVEVVRSEALAGQKPAILREMRTLCETTALTQVIFMITDVRARASDLWFVGARREVFERAFGSLVSDAVHLPGCMSRKKQIVPELEKAFEAAARTSAVNAQTGGPWLAREPAEEPTMDIAELMTKGVMTCSLTDTLERAAQIMWDHDCDAVPITDERGRTIGIVTDRDVSMTAYTQGKPLAQIPVSVAASRHLIAASADDTIERVTDMMRAHRLRSVPILSSEGKAVGIVGLGDLARHAMSPRRMAVLSPDAIARTLAAISARQDAETAKAPVFHVRTLDGGWMVFDREGNRVSEIQRTQSDGVVHAKELARRAGSAQVIVHRENGTVASEFFYQRDERSSLASDDAVPTFAASRPARARRAAGQLGRLLSAVRGKAAARSR